MKALRDPFFLLTMAAFSLGALAWGLFLPVHEAPDEQNHYRYIIFLRDQGRLPVQLPLPPEVAGEGHQPPLYYALGAKALGWLDPEAAWVELPGNPDFAFNSNPAWFSHFAEESFLKFDGYARGPHLLRASQIWMPLLSLCALWLLLNGLSLKPGAARAAFALMALNPGFVFLSGALNNDHLVTLFFSLAVLVMADAVLQRSWGWGHSLLCGAALGLGALTKISIFCLFPLALLVAWKHGGLGKALAGLGVAAALAGWFYWRNAALYGDPFGWEMHALTCPNTVHAKRWDDWGWAWFWLKRSFESFWIIFGWLSWSAPRWSNAIFIALAALAAAGLWRKGWNESTLLLALAFAGLAAGVIKFNWNFDPPEGRYFYPALLPIGALMARGFDAFRWRQRAPAAWLGLALLAGFNVWIVFYRLIPLYYNV